MTKTSIDKLPRTRRAVRLEWALVVTSIYHRRELLMGVPGSYAPFPTAKELEDLAQDTHHDRDWTQWRWVGGNEQFNIRSLF